MELVFYPGTKLVEILEKYGFTENTNDVYHNHEYLMYKPYEPSVSCRAFKKCKIQIFFDYRMMSVLYKDSLLLHSDQITISELTSIIHYTNCDSGKRISLRNKVDCKIQRLFDFYEHFIIEKPNYTNTVKKSLYEQRNKLFWLRDEIENQYG